jgi:hypothetical protein
MIKALALSALTKKTPVPRIQFYYICLETGNNAQKHKFAVARLCWPMRFEMRDAPTCLQLP